MIWLRLYLRLFYAVFVPYFIGMNAFLLIWTGNILYALLYGTMTALSAGFVVTLILFGFAWQNLKELEFRVEDDPLSSFHERRIVVPLTPGEAFERCLESLKMFSRYQIIVSDPEKGLLSVSLPRSMSRAFGTIITYLITPAGEQNSSINVTSNVKWNLHLLDYGKSLEDLLYVCKYLTEADRKALQKKSL